MNLKWLATMLQLVLPMLTPEIKAELTAAFDALAEKAKATPNPIDDLVIAFIRSLLGL